MYSKTLPHLDLNIYNYVANAIDNLKEIDIGYKNKYNKPERKLGLLTFAEQGGSHGAIWEPKVIYKSFDEQITSTL